MTFNLAATVMDVGTVRLYPQSTTHSLYVFCHKIFGLYMSVFMHIHAWHLVSSLDLLT